MLERPHPGAAAHGGPDFDLAGFISELRSEALALRGGESLSATVPANTSPTPPAWMLAPRAAAPELRPAPVVEAPAPTPFTPSGPSPASTSAPVRASTVASTTVAVPPALAPEAASAAMREAERLLQQGRLGVPSVPRFSEESLFGFSVRELSSPDPSARIRDAERLRMLGERAAAPALAVALHGERDPTVLVALLDAFRALAAHEGTAVVAPLLDSPDTGVRIAALRAITTLDPDTAASYLAKAAHDTQPSVRRRAALLAVTLGPERTLELEREAARDPDPDVRRLVVLATGAAGGEAARGRLLASLDDSDLGVRRAAARSLSRLLGVELGHVPELSDEERRREIRRLSTLETPPLAVRARLDEPLPEPVIAPERAPSREFEPLATEESDPGPSPALHSDEALCLQIAQELQGSMRGRTVLDLAGQLGVNDSGLESPGQPPFSRHGGPVVRQDEACARRLSTRTAMGSYLAEHQDDLRAAGSAFQGHPGGAGSREVFRHRSVEAPQGTAALPPAAGKPETALPQLQGRDGEDLALHLLRLPAGGAGLLGAPPRPGQPGTRHQVSGLRGRGFREDPPPCPGAQGAALRGHPAHPAAQPRLRAQQPGDEYRRSR